MTQIIITRELLREWNACYCDDKINYYVPESGLTPLQILDLDIPTEDRLWVILREEIIPARELRLLACKWARGALAVAGNPDPRSVAAVDCAERFAMDEVTAEELDSARAAAWAAAQAAARYADWAAAWAAARAAAQAAARYAAWAAAQAAARDAARDAARYAAQAAARDAARDAALDDQINDFRSVLESVAIYAINMQCM
jgi:hypothetical protein